MLHGLSPASIQHMSNMAMQTTDTKPAGHQQHQARETDACSPSDPSKAATVACQYADAPELDYAGSAVQLSPEEARLVDKLDMRLLPFCWMFNFLSFLQRLSLSVAPLGGLNKDLGLVGTQFSTAVAVHSVGYILGQVPSNLILTRTRPSRVFAVAGLLSSIVTLCLVAVRDFTGLALQRFFLGIISAPLWPGTMYIASTFYRRKEIGSRISVLYSSQIASTAFQGLLAAPIFSELSGVRGLNGWQWMYLVIGTAMGLCSVMALLVLPDDPGNTWWLTSNERQLARNRIAADTVEITEDVSIWKGVNQVIRDKHVWIFALSHHMHTATTGFRNFLPSLMATFGYSTTITLVITCPPYILGAAVALLVGWTSGNVNERTWHITGQKVVATVGFSLACATMNTGVRMLGAFLFVGCTFGVYSLTMGWVGITCGQTKEKRAAALAFINSIGSMSQIWTPYIWPSSASPRYLLPLASSAVMGVITILCVWLIKASLARENNRIRRQDENATLIYAH